MRIYRILLILPILITKLYAGPLENKPHKDFLDYFIDFSNESSDVSWITKYISETNGKLTLVKFDASSSFLRGMFLFSLLRATDQNILASTCQNTACFQYNLLSWTLDDLKSIDRAAKIFSGKPLIKNIEVLPNGFFVKYDESGITAIFNKLYKKPTEKYKGQMLQAFYDATFKDWVAERYSFTKEIMADPAKLQRLKLEYFNKARTNPNFSGTEETMAIVAEYGCDTFIGLQKYPGKKCDERWLGTLIRRSEDETLPLLLRLMESVVKDYDPELYKIGTIIPKIPSKNKILR